MDWASTGGASERAALLLIDGVGAEKIVCLPARTQAKLPLPEVRMRRLLDVGWNDGLVVAGARGRDNDDELVLVTTHDKPRILAHGVRSARLSPDATALAYESDTSRQEKPTSYVFELGTDKLIALSGLVDALWEADGRHLRATELREDGERTQRGHWRSVRVRWERESGTTTVEGPGSAQLPAPVGSTVAWTEEQRAASPPSQCAVFLSPRGGVKHAVVGSFCAGIADDRGVRWSPDGRWLAFAHPEQGAAQRGRVFVDVVSADGGRYPALSGLAARLRPDALVLPHGLAMWFDWSPSGRFLAFDNGAGDLRVYDFEMHGMAALGKGARPTWSPGGAYLLVAENEAAVVLSGAGPQQRINLGAIRDARWLPAQACAP